MLNRDVQRAKAELAKHVETLILKPHGEGPTGHYVAEGEWDLLGGFGQGAGSPATMNVQWLLIKKGGRP